MKILKPILNWLFWVAVAVGIYFGYQHIKPLPPIHGAWVLFFGLASAFTWVHILKWGVSKPFSCTKCMSGWLSLAIAAFVQADYWPLYLFGGLFVGAMWEAVKGRYL